MDTESTDATNDATKDASTKVVWILTSSINQYNQEGDYFEAAFLEKPTVEQLREVFDEGELDIPMTYDFEHLLNGGGRIKDEDTWYELSMAIVGTSYRV